VSGARHGWILEWFVKDDDTLVDRVDVIDMTVEELQDVFDEPSADSMMCYSYRVGPEHARAIRGTLIVRSTCSSLTTLCRHGRSPDSGHRLDSTRPPRISPERFRMLDAFAR